MKKKKVCFISGAITGVDGYLSKFAKAETEIQQLGMVPFNPAAMTRPLMNAGVQFDHDEWLEIDLACLKQCDLVYHLDNWRSSKGAIKEHQLALAYSKPILYQVNFNSYYQDAKKSKFKPEKFQVMEPWDD